VQIPTTVFRQVLTRTYGEIVKAVFLELGVPAMRVQYLSAPKKSRGGSCSGCSSVYQAIQVGFREQRPTVEHAGTPLARLCSQDRMNSPTRRR
jgi:hypothetical protein